MDVQIINDKKYFVQYTENIGWLDYIAIRMLEQNNIKGLLSFKYVQQEEDKYFRYEVKEEETLREWLAKEQYKESVLNLIESLIFINEEIDAYLLIENHICTDPLFITVKNNKCEVPYVPVENEKLGNILQLVQEIVTSVRFAPDSDYGYLFDLQNAFGRRDIKTISDLKKWIRIVQGEEKMPDVTDESHDYNELTSADVTPCISTSADLNKKAIVNPSIPKKEEQKDSFEAIFGDIGFDSIRKEKTADKTGKVHGIFFKNRKGKNEGNEVIENKINQSISHKQDIPKREIINDLNRGDSTVMIGARMTLNLVHVKSGMEYHLQNDSYVIGSGAQADIVVQNNPSVSRKHARIFRNNDSYFIEDLGSTNGTSVNGERLRKMEPYKLDDRARINFSNEDYILEIRR